MLLISKLNFSDEMGIKEPLYFQPPITTNNSRKIISPAIDPTDILLIKPFLIDFFFIFFLL